MIYFIYFKNYLSHDFFIIQFRIDSTYYVCNTFIYLVFIHLFDQILFFKFNFNSRFSYSKSYV